MIQDGHVLIEDGRIAAVGFEPAPAIDADEVVSVAGYVVTPGLVNIHHHLYQTHTRAVLIGCGPAATAETGSGPRIDTHTVLGHFQTPVTLEN